MFGFGKAAKRDAAAAKEDIERQAKRKQEIIDWNKAAQQKRVVKIGTKKHD